MKKINTNYIKSLYPCKDRFDNWIEQYDDRDFTLFEFLDLDKITHEDKLWVYFRSINKKLIPLVAGEFAKNVLHLYENLYPNDFRPKLAIAAALNKNVKKSTSYVAISRADAAYAAYDAVRGTAHTAPAARAAARAAAYAACARSSYHIAYYAVRAAYAAYTAHATSVSCNKEKENQIKIMKKYIRKNNK